MDVFDETQNKTEDDYLGIRGELAKYLDGNANGEHARGSNGYDADQINANGHGNGNDDENDESHDEDFEEYGEGELLADSGPRVAELEAEGDSASCEHVKSQEPQEQGSVECDQKRSLEHDPPAEEASSLREREEITESKVGGEIQREGLEEYSRQDDRPGAGSGDVSCDEDGEGEMGAQAGGEYAGSDQREEVETDGEEDMEEMGEAREEEEEGETGELGLDEGQTGTEMTDENQEEEEGDENEEDEGRSEETGFGGVQAGAEIKGGKQEEEEENEDEEEEEDDDGDDGEDGEEDMAIITEENREQIIREGESGDQDQEDQSGAEATETQAAEENDEEEESEEVTGEEEESEAAEGEEEESEAAEGEEEESEAAEGERELDKEDQELKAAMQKEEETGNAKIRMEIADNEDLRRTRDGPQKADTITSAYRRQFFHSDTTSSISSMHVNAPSPQTSDITDSSSDESDVRRGAYSPRSDLEEAADGGNPSPPRTTPNGRGSTADWSHKDWAGQVIAIKCSGKMFNGDKAAAETIPSVYVSKEYNHDDEEALPSDGDDADVNVGDDESGEDSPPVAEVSRYSSDAARPFDDVSRPNGESSRPIDEVSRPNGESTGPIDEISRDNDEATRPVDQIPRHNGESTRPADEVPRHNGEATRPVGETYRQTEEVTLPAGDICADPGQAGRVRELGKLFDRGAPVFPRSMSFKTSDESGDDSPVSVRKYRALFEADRPAVPTSPAGKERKEDVSGPPTGTVQSLRGMFENPKRNS